MPRFGFAYKLNEKTVVRGGYGIFYGFLGQRRGDVVQSGFSQTTNFVPTSNNGVTFNATLTNPFPNGIQQPVGAAQGQQTFLGQGITFFNQHPLTPYMQRWEIGIQRELPHGFVVEAAYVGNRGTHIENARNVNVTPQKYFSLGSAYLTQTVPNPFFGILSGNSVIGAQSKIARERLLRPFPEYDYVIVTNNDGYSWYHSAQFRAEKRFSKGYTIQASYTWSKLMQATEYLNQDDPLPVKVISDQDYPHRLAVSGIYELPFGKGHQLFSTSHGIVSRIIGGWQLQGVYTYQSGAPINFGVSANSPITGVNTPNQGYTFTGNFTDIQLPSNQQTVDHWFNTAGFATLASAQPDHVLRTFPLRFGFVRAANINNLDFSFLKSTSINERMRIQFRFEMINAFNRPLFAAPNVTATNASFGQIVATNQANYPRRIQLSLKFLF